MMSLCQLQRLVSDQRIVGDESVERSITDIEALLMHTELLLLLSAAGGLVNCSNELLSV